MIKPIQSSESVAAQPLKNFKGAESKAPSRSAASNANIQALETKYNLACLLAATTQLENEKLRQELAISTALLNYSKACC